MTEKKENVVTIQITNCLKCQNCYTDRILTADSFEHEQGAYCSLVEDTEVGKKFGQNGKHRIIASDDWHLERYTQIPDWCPLLEKNKTETPKE